MEYLSALPAADLEVLKDMPRIRDKVDSKLACREVVTLGHQFSVRFASQRDLVAHYATNPLIFVACLV